MQSAISNAVLEYNESLHCELIITSLRCMTMKIGRDLGALNSENYFYILSRTKVKFIDLNTRFINCCSNREDQSIV
jgi:hypothetical protein